MHVENKLVEFVTAEEQEYEEVIEEYKGRGPCAGGGPGAITN